MAQTTVDAIQEHQRAHMIQIPRLVRLIKEACAAPDDIVIRNQAIDLAAKLYHNDLELLVLKFLETGLMKVMPSSPKYRDFVEKSFGFTSFLAYACCIQYWTFRIMLGGFVLKLLSLPDMIISPFPFDTSAIEAHDVQAAECIAMCTEYSSKQTLKAFWFSFV